MYFQIRNLIPLFIVFISLTSGLYAMSPEEKIFYLAKKGYFGQEVQKNVASPEVIKDFYFIGKVFKDEDATNFFSFPKISDIDLLKETPLSPGHGPLFDIAQRTIEGKLGIIRDVKYINYPRVYSTFWLGGKPDEFRLKSLTTIFNAIENNSYPVEMNIWTKDKSTEMDLVSSLPDIMKKHAKIRYIFPELIDDKNPDHAWLKEMYAFYENNKIFAGMTDLSRWLVLEKEGGHYMDFSLGLAPGNDSYLTRTEYDAPVLVSSLGVKLNDVSFYFINSDRFSVPTRNHNFVNSIIQKMKLNWTTIKSSRFLQSVFAEDGPFRRHLMIRFNVLPIVHTLFEESYNLKISEEELLKDFVSDEYFMGRNPIFTSYGNDISLLGRITSREGGGVSWSRYERAGNNMRAVMLYRYLLWCNKIADSRTDLRERMSKIVKLLDDYSKNGATDTYDVALIAEFMDLEKDYGLIPHDDKVLFPEANMLRLLAPDNEGNNALHRTAIEDRSDDIREIINAFPETVRIPDYIKNADHDTPLHIAVRKKNINFVKNLIALEPKFENDPAYIFGKRNKTALHIAVENDSPDLVELLSSIPAQYYDAAGKSVISDAIEMGKLDSAKNLLSKAKGNLQGKDSSGNTVLHFAVMHKAQDLIKEILKIDPKLAFIQNEDGETPLMLALRAEYYDISSAVAIVQTSPGALSVANTSGYTALHFAAAAGFTEFFEAILKILPDRKYFLSLTENGSSVLSEAVSSGNLSLLKMIDEAAPQLLRNEDYWWRQDKDYLLLALSSSEQNVQDFLLPKVPLKRLVYACITHQFRETPDRIKNLFYSDYVYVNADDVINHAKTASRDYDVPYLETTEGRHRINLTLTMLAIGEVPRSLQENYPAKSFYDYRTSKYALLAIADSVTKNKNVLDGKVRLARPGEE